jgi:hypothetical protein
MPPLLPLRRCPVNAVPLLVLAVSLVSSSCAPALRNTAEGPLDARKLAELWTPPASASSRNLFYGPGGRAGMPAPTERFIVTDADTTGNSRGYDVVDSRGRKWKVKLGEEVQPEIVASRLLWAIGFHQPAVYYVPAIRLAGGDPGDEGKPARLRAEFGYSTEGDWSWHENPYVGTRQLNGLLIANLILNNWDLKPSQNRIYEIDEPGRGPARRFVVQDLGAALGRTAWPVGNRNDVEGFEAQNLIRAVRDGKVEFDYDARHTELFRNITSDDVVWTSRLFARLTDSQWQDAFRAAAYAPDVRQRFIAKLKAKVQEGLNLGRDAGAAR